MIRLELSLKISVAVDESKWRKESVLLKLGCMLESLEGLEDVPVPRLPSRLVRSESLEWDLGIHVTGPEDHWIG